MWRPKRELLGMPPACAVRSLQPTRRSHVRLSRLASTPAHYAVMDAAAGADPQLFAFRPQVPRLSATHIARAQSTQCNASTIAEERQLFRNMAQKYRHVVCGFQSDCRSSSSSITCHRSSDHRHGAPHVTRSPSALRTPAGRLGACADAPKHTPCPRTRLPGRT